jgi:hypothetical protein
MVAWVAAALRDLRRITGGNASSPPAPATTGDNQTGNMTAGG